MSQNILFETSRFIAPEPNATSGQELLHWLGQQLVAHGVTMEKAQAKSGGWVASATHGNVRYELVLAKPTGTHWNVTIDKQRGLADRLLAKNQLAPTDPFVWLVENALQGEPDVKNVRRA